MMILQAKSCVGLLLLMIFCFNLCSTKDSRFKHLDVANVQYTIIVDQSGQGNFTTIQSAIDSVPTYNNQWIHIRIAPGTYTEKVTIPWDKQFLFLEGAGRRLTTIVWNDFKVIGESATFTSSADNFVAKGITFKNDYAVQFYKKNDAEVKQAVAARILGDKSAFYNCRFVAVGDTLWDALGRHYYYKCYIKGAVDFIFGEGRTIFESCIISTNAATNGIQEGFITAQRRMSPDETVAFVFNYCKIVGNGNVFLGRPWGPYSTVIIANSMLSDVVTPSGWYPWNYAGQEENFTYAEFNNSGPGANTSNRVPWVKKLNADQVSQYLDIKFINSDGWMAGLPATVNV